MDMSTDAKRGLTKGGSTISLVHSPSALDVGPSQLPCGEHSTSGTDTTESAGRDSSPKQEGEPSLKQQRLERHAARFTCAGFSRFVGSGLLMSVAYLDPGNLEADINVGQNTGYTLLWFYLLSNLCFGFCFQCLSGKLGMVTGEDLAGMVGREWPAGSRWLLWALLEASVIAADIQETVGCSLAISILSNGAIPLYGGAIMVSATAFLLLYLDKLSFRWMELVYLALISTEAVALGVNCFKTAPPAGQVVLGIVRPQLVQGALVQAIGAIGSLVMPYNVFYQSHVVTRREHDKSTPARMQTLLTYMRLELWIVLAFAFVVNLFVVVVFAEEYYHPTGFGDIGLQSAGAYLAQRFGESYRYFWAVGLLAAGQVATITLTYAGQNIMLGLLRIQLGAEWRMIATRCIALVPTVTLAVVFQTAAAFDKVASTINVIQSVLLPFGLIPCVHMSANHRILGNFTNRVITTVFASGVCALVLGVNGWLIITLALDSTLVPQNAGTHAGFALLLVVYYGLALYFAVGPTRWPGVVQRSRSGAVQLTRWLHTNRRWADIESMLEVHC